MIKNLKKLLKKKKLLNKYKNKFNHKKIQFIGSKIYLLFNAKPLLNKMVKFEEELLSLDINENMFLTCFENNFQELKKEMDIKSLSFFLWEIFQFSIFETNSNFKKYQNTQDDFIKLHSNKRKHFNKWIESLDPTQDNLNDKVIKLLKETC